MNFGRCSEVVQSKKKGLHGCEPCGPNFFFNNLHSLHIVKGIRYLKRYAAIAQRATAQKVAAMIAANNSIPADSLDPDAPITEFYHCQFPDLNRETKSAITKASSCPMWIGINSVIREQIRIGRTAAIRAAAENRQISTGIRYIAKDIGLDPSTAREQCRRLVELGLIHISEDDRPFKTDPVTGEPLFKTDPVTGKILANRAGRAKPVTITITLKNRHMRPQSSGKKAKQLVVRTATTNSLIGGVQTPPDFTDRGRTATTVIESYKELNKERPSGLTDGIGRPMAKDENTTPPPLPMGSRPKGPRITPAARTEPPRPAWQATTPRRTNSYSEDFTPKKWSPETEDAFAYTKAKYELERTNHSPPVAREWLQPREATA